jgi:ribosome-associated translation inhibitor RaiA
MQSLVQITLQDVPHSAALDARIREKVRKLEKLFPRVAACRVVISAPHHHQLHRRLFTVRLNIEIPGSEVVVTRNNHEDVYVLLRDAFVTAKRELESVMRRHDRDGVRHAHAWRSALTENRRTS